MESTPTLLHMSVCSTMSRVPLSPQYGKKETGNVGYVPPGWDQWHALVSPVQTHDILVHDDDVTAVLMLLCVCRCRWGTLSTTTTLCQSTVKRSSTETIMKKTTSQTS